MRHHHDWARICLPGKLILCFTHTKAQMKWRLFYNWPFLTKDLLQDVVHCLYQDLLYDALPNPGNKDPALPDQSFRSLHQNKQFLNLSQFKPRNNIEQFNPRNLSQENTLKKSTNNSWLDCLVRALTHIDSCTSTFWRCEHFPEINLRSLRRFNDW